MAGDAGRAWPRAAIASTLAAFAVFTAIGAAVFIAVAAAPTAFAAPASVGYCADQLPDPGSGVTDQADDLAKLHLYRQATDLYDRVLDSSVSTLAERACAARGLAAIAVATRSHPSSAQEAGSRWDTLYADWILPLSKVLAPALAVFAVLLVISRIATGWLVGANTPGLRTTRPQAIWAMRLAYLAGLAGLGMSAALATSGWAAAQASDGAAVAEELSASAVPIVAIQAAALFAVVALCGRSTPRRRRNAIIFAAAMAIVWAIVAVSPWRPDRWHSLAAVVTWALASAVLGICLIGRTRGVQIGLIIQGRGPDGSDNAGIGELVRARLHAIGTEPPRGIQITQQTDVDSLPANALNLLPDGALAKAAMLIAQLFTPATPWKVTVTDHADGRTSVVLQRNGRTVSSEVVNVARFGLPAASSTAGDGDGGVTSSTAASNWPLRTAAAAFILVSLSQRYRYLRGGLCGATRWDSVAAQVIGSDTSGAISSDQRLTLLAYAVAFDARNLAARVALLNGQYRDGATRAETLTYIHALQRLFDDQDALGWPTEMRPMRLRILFNLGVGWFNYGLAQLAADDHDAAVEALRQAEVTTTRLLVDAETDAAALPDLRDQIFPAAWFVHQSIRAERDRLGQPPVDATSTAIARQEPGNQLTMLARYERACLHAARREYDAAITDLQIATRVPWIRVWARSDPSLAGLQDGADDAVTREQRAAFKNLVGDAGPGSILGLQPFAPYRPIFEALGLRTAEQIDRASSLWLSSQAGVAHGIAEQWRRVAGLFRVVEQSDLPQQPRCDAAQVLMLLGTGIDAVEALREQVAQPNRQGLQDGLRQAALALDEVAPGPDTIVAWWRQLARDAPAMEKAL
jgi:hypothetical protein